MPTLLGVQVALAARNAGLPDDKLITAVAIAKAESGWNTDARNAVHPDDSYGLWQINRLAHPQYSPAFLRTAEGNAAAMVAISSGGTNWRPWSVFLNGSYRLHLDAARVAVQGIGAGGSVVVEQAPGVPQPPQYTPAPDAPLVAGLGVHGPNEWTIEGESVSGHARVLSAEIDRSIDEASTLTLNVLDPTRELLRSDLLQQRSRVQLDGIHWELADIRKQGNDLSLVFIDAAAATFIHDEGKTLTQAPNAATRGEFLRRLCAEHPEYEVDIETGATTLEELRTEPDESLWQAMGRIAREIDWRRLATANRILIGSDEWLASRTQPLTLREHTAGVQSIDFDYTLGVDVDEARLDVDAALWAGPPTQAVTLEDVGVADGDWIVARITRPLGSTRARIVLTRPSPALPEPLPASTGTVLEGLDLGTVIPGLGPQVDTSETSWAGTQAICEALTADFEQLGLTLTSAKRDRQNTVGGNTSDHWTGNLVAYAQDWSNGGSPTPQMDAAAERVMGRLGVRHSGQSALVYSGTHTFNGIRVRVQVLYRTSVGGNHFNHIHVGVERR